MDRASYRDARTHLKICTRLGDNKNLLSRETVRVRMRVKVRDRIWWDEEEREGDGEGKKQLENEGQLVM